MNPDIRNLERKVQIQIRCLNPKLQRSSPLMILGLGQSAMSPKGRRSQLFRVNLYLFDRQYRQKLIEFEISSTSSPVMTTSLCRPFHQKNRRNQRTRRHSRPPQISSPCNDSQAHLPQLLHRLNLLEPLIPLACRDPSRHHDVLSEQGNQSNKCHIHWT